MGMGSPRRRPHAGRRQGGVGLSGLGRFSKKSAGEREGARRLHDTEGVWQPQRKRQLGAGGKSPAGEGRVLA